MGDSGKNEADVENPDSGAPGTLQTLAPEAPDFLQNLGFSIPGISFQDSSSFQNSPLHQASDFDSLDASAAGTSVPASCAVNSACFDELIATSEAKSLPADGTQSASAAVKMNAAQQSLTVEHHLLASAAPADGSPRVDDKRILRKKRPVESHPEPVKIPPLKEIQDMLETQKKLLDSQLSDLEKLVHVQLRLTGVNPLAQELSSAVLGQRSVKKPDPPLSQDALQLLRDVYAVKDTATKKEVRDLSLLTGATEAQVREFFAGQQGRVRRLLHQLSLDGVGVHVEQSRSHFFPANTSGISGLTTSDSVEKLVESMRVENTFTGQSNILHFILQADYVPGLRLFLDRGGLRFLSKWLNQAVVEEQTSLIRLILKAFFHLPMGHALPAQVSPLVQIMSRLRTHFATDISTSSRTLIAKWSKLFARTGAGKVPGQAAEPRKNDGNSAQEPFKQSSSSGHPPGPEKKKQKTDPGGDNKPDALKPQNKAVLAQPNLKGLHMSERPSSSANLRRTLQTVEDPALASEASKKRLAEHGKEKRRVVLVEEISATRRVRDGEAKRSTGSEKGSRPLSADEIRKAKMRERLFRGSNPRDNQQQPAGAAGRPRESTPTSTSRSTEAEPPASSTSLFQAAHSLPSRQQHEFHHDLNRPPPEVQRGSRPPPPPEQNPGQQHDYDLNRPPPEAQRGSWPPPPPEQVPGAYRLGEHLHLNRMQQPEPAPSLFQPAHALPGRQDSAVPPPVSLPFFNMVQQAPAAQQPPQVPQPWLDPARIPDQMQQQAAVPELENQTGKPQAESKADVVVEDRDVAEAEGDHPLDSPSPVLIADMLRRMVSWSIPSAVFVDPRWSVARGEESKEKEIQSGRVRREAEEFYSNPDAIPQNPKDPWDEEQDYDDSLTLEVPLEPVDEPEQEKQSSQAPAQTQPAPGHDPELLAILLRNPALVSELTSGQGLQGLQSFQGLKGDSNQHFPPSQGQFSQTGGQPVDVYGHQQQYYGNAGPGGYNPGSDHRAQWSNGGETFNRQQQPQHQNQQQYYNHKGGNHAGNPTQWKQRVSNNNMSFGHGFSNTNQGVEQQMGLRPPPHHYHHQLPNNVVGNDRFRQQPHLPPHQQQHHQHQHQQQQQQQPWYNTSLHHHTRPGGW